MAAQVWIHPGVRIPLAAHREIARAARSSARWAAQCSSRRRGRTAREQGGQARDEGLHAERLSQGGPARALEERLAVRVRDLARDEDHPGREPRELALDALEQGAARDAGETEVHRDHVELLRVLVQEAPRAPGRAAARPWGGLC